MHDHLISKEINFLGNTYALSLRLAFIGLGNLNCDFFSLHMSFAIIEFPGLLFLK